MPRKPTKATQEQKDAMLKYGTWHLFLARKEQYYAENECKPREERSTKGDLFDKALKEFMPKAGEVPPVNAKRVGLSRAKEALREYDESNKGRVFTDEGVELRAPGDYVNGEAPDLSAPPGEPEGDMGDIGDEVPDWDDDDLEEAKSKVDALTGTKIEVAEQLKWVLDHIYDDKVKLRKQAPAPMAWTIMKQCRDSATFREKFILTILPKMLPKDLGEREEKEDDSFDGDEVVDAIGEIMAMAEQAKGDE